MCERREDERTGEEARISMNSLGGVILRPVTLSFLLSLRTILPCDCDCVGMEEERRGEGERKERRGRGREEEGGRGRKRGGEGGRERGEIYMCNKVNLHVHHSRTLSHPTLTSDVALSVPSTSKLPNSVFRCLRTCGCLCVVRGRGKCEHM